MKEDKEFTSEDLEVLLKLWNAKEPISYVDLQIVPNSFKVTLNLLERGLVTKFEGSDERYPHQKVSFYELTNEGEKGLNKIFQYASKYFEKIMNSN